MKITEELAALGFTETIWERIASKVTVTETGCHEWQASRLPSGYGRVGRGKSGYGCELSHRAVWMLHHGPIAAGEVVRHKCDNPRCCNILHLELGTQADNLQDMRDRGRSNYRRGEAHRSAKLSDEKVALIRDEARQVLNDAEVGRRHGISKQYTRSIRLGLSRAA